MTMPLVDGLAVLSELTDDALLVSNLLERPVRGRDRIVNIMQALEQHFDSIADVEHLNTPGHRIIDSRALLPSGKRVRMTVYATRDNRGYISEVSLTLDDAHALPELVGIVREAAGWG